MSDAELTGQPDTPETIDYVRKTVPTKMRPYYDAIVSLTDAAGKQLLDQELTMLCRTLAAALCRKRNSIVNRGDITEWACGVAYTIGRDNSVFSRGSATMTSADLCAFFGVSARIGSTRAKQIRVSMGIGDYDAGWVRPSKRQEEPVPSLAQAMRLLRRVVNLPPKARQEAVRVMQESRTSDETP